LVTDGSHRHFQISKFSNSQIETMNKIATYFKESYQELMTKVTWPSWSQLQQSTVIVLVATVIITAMVAVMDFSSNQLLKLVYSLFKS
jgi:preprotein translocase subunit SecE